MIFVHPPPMEPALIQIAFIVGNAFKKLEEGMPKDKVIALLGRPDGQERDGQADVLTYKNRLMSGWGWDRADYYVVLKDGVVASYGIGDVRPHEAPRISIPTNPSGAQSQGLAAGASRGSACVFKRDWVAGLNRNCVYDCSGSEAVRTQEAATLCSISVTF